MASLLKNTSTPQHGLARAMKIPAMSTTMICMFNKSFPPPATSPNQYPTVVVVPLMETVVPYDGGKASDKNLVKRDAVFPDIVLDAGKKTMFVSIYTIPANLMFGDIILLEGLTFNVYIGDPNDQTGRTSFLCTRISLVRDKSLQSLLDNVPLENKSLSFDRDIPSPETGTFDMNDKTFTFFHVKVTQSPPEIEDGVMYGKFMPPPEGDPSGYEFTPHQKDKSSTVVGSSVLALTGGTETNGVTDNQFFICRNGLKDTLNPYLILARTRLYKDSLDRLQVDWLKIGSFIVPFLEGEALCIQNRNKSVGQTFDSETNVSGAIWCKTSFYPDIKAIMSAAGIEMSWDTVKKIVPGKMKDPSRMQSELYVPKLVVHANGINIFRFNGSITRLEKGIKDGEIKLYMVSNMLESHIETLRENSTEDNVLAMMSNPKNFKRKEPHYEVFAVTTEATKFRIQDYVSTIPGLPPLVDTIGASQSSVPPEVKVSETEEPPNKKPRLPKQ